MSPCAGRKASSGVGGASRGRYLGVRGDVFDGCRSSLPFSVVLGVCDGADGGDDSAAGGSVDGAGGLLDDGGDVSSCRASGDGTPRSSLGGFGGTRSRGSVSSAGPRAIDSWRSRGRCQVAANQPTAPLAAIARSRAAAKSGHCQRTANDRSLVTAWAGDAAASAGGSAAEVACGASAAKRNLGGLPFTAWGRCGARASNRDSSCCETA